MNYSEEYIKVITDRVADIIRNIENSRGYEIVITDQMSVPFISYKISELVETPMAKLESEEKE